MTKLLGTNVKSSFSQILRRNSLAAALVLGSLFAAPTALHATAYTVNALTDARPTLGGAGTGTTGDLRYCITQANYVPTGVTHTIAFTVTGTVTLASHELVINSNLTIDGPGAAALTVDANGASRVFYVAPGRTVKISGLSLTNGSGIGNDATGLDPGASYGYDGSGGAILNDQSVLTVGSCKFTGSTAGAGGAIYNRADGANATLLVTSCTISNNNATDPNNGGGGLAAYAFGGTSTLNVSGSTISNNVSVGDGGGIFNHGLDADPANLTVVGSTISGNSSGGFDGGGGIFTSAQEDGGTVSSATITGCVVSGNTLTGSSTSGGGGILNGGLDRGHNTMTLRSTLVTGNTSNTTGGGVATVALDAPCSTELNMIGCTVSANTAATSGAGVFNYGYQGSSTLNVNDCTIAANSAGERGGGIYNLGTGSTTFGDSSVIVIGNSTICGNAASSGGGGIANDQPQAGGVAKVTLSNTLLALHPTGANFGTAYGTAASGGHNLSDDASCGAFFTAVGDSNSVSAGLQVNGSGLPILQSNGGPTPTVALLATSGAIDAGKAANDPVTGLPAVTDQRGYVRAVEVAGKANAVGGDGSDIGAFEYGSAPFISADLSKLAVSNGTLSPSFAAGTISYTDSVLKTTASMTVTPTVARVNAMVKVNGVAVATGKPSAPIKLALGTNVITIVVTAQDGVTKKTYTVTVTRGPSSNAALRNLALSAGPLAPAFASGTSSYALSVPNTIASTTVTPTAAQANAVVRVDGTAVASGKPSAPIALAAGANTITILVTAQDGVTAKTYKVVVTRTPSANAQLSNLVLSAGTLSPAFTAGKGGYTASVPYATASITLTPTAAQANATIKVNGVAVASGKPSAAIVLAVGSNPIKVVVTAQNGTTTASYGVVVTRAPSGNAALSKLVLSSGTLSPAFSSSTHSYSASVSNATASIAVAPTVLQANATAKVDGVAVPSGKAVVVKLIAGANTVSIVVVAQNGVTTETYRVIVTRAAAAIEVARGSTLRDERTAPVASRAAVAIAVVPRGVYTGVLETGGPNSSFDGLIELVVAAPPGPGSVSGPAFTGVLHRGVDRYTLRGNLDALGAYAGSIGHLGGLAPLTLTIDPIGQGSSVLTGTVSGGSVLTSFTARRSTIASTSKPSPFAGKYSLSLKRRIALGSSGPRDAGAGIVTIEASGRLNFAARLAGGAAVSQSTAVSEDGVWPLFAAPDGALGFLAGEVRFQALFEAQPESVLAGTADRIAPFSKSFPAGMRTRLDVAGQLSAVPTSTVAPMNIP